MLDQNEIIEAINNMTNEQQRAFYDGLRAKGISEDAIQAVQAVAFYTKLYADPRAYLAVRTAMGQVLYAEFTK